MAQRPYDPEMKGTLGKNRKLAEESEGAPEYRGKCQIGGVVYWISAWVATNKDEQGEAQKYLSMRFEEADMKYQPKRQRARDERDDAPTRARSTPAYDEDDVPF
jgi:hypothetical protein